MMRYFVFAVLLVLAMISSVSATERATAGLTRAQIRQMPLLERPNRPGHFYGNTVRWLHERRLQK